MAACCEIVHGNIKKTLKLLITITENLWEAINNVNSVKPFFNPLKKSLYRLHRSICG